MDTIIKIKLHNVIGLELGTLRYSNYPHEAVEIEKECKRFRLS